MPGPGPFWVGRAEATIEPGAMQNSDSSEQPRCALCGRQPRRGTTEHHLVPRSCHTNKWFRKRFAREELRRTVSLCRDCHRAVHRFVPREKDLGRFYNTVEDLLAHPEIAKFVAWISRR